MLKSNQERIKQAKKHLKRIRELVAQKPSPFAGMTEEEVIGHLRKTRKQLWERKLATRP
jgi:archaellum component FlaC